MMLYTFANQHVNDDRQFIRAGLDIQAKMECAKLVQLRRLELDFHDAGSAAFHRSVTVFPITLEIARKSTQLDLSSDPVDEIIGATSVVENIPLLTRDRRILKSKMVPLAPNRRQ